jgi:hypothetical protein
MLFLQWLKNQLFFNAATQYERKKNNMRRSRKNRKWSGEMVLEEIRQWNQRGEPLYSHHVRKKFQELLAAGIRYYGSWRGAVEQAGIQYSDVRKYQHWTKDLIVAQIQELFQQGTDLSFRAMMLSSYNSMVYAAIRPKHFGSWKAALTAAGLAPDEIYRYRSWNEASILEEIRQLSQQGMDLSSKTMDESANPLIATARRRFGNWGAAVEKAGLDYAAIRRRRRWSSEKIVEGIRELRSQGVRLRSGEVRKQAPALFAAA